MGEEAIAMRKRFEQAYWRLSPVLQRKFDLECAEHVLPLYEARRPGDTRVMHLLERVRANADETELEPLRRDLYASMEAERDDDDFEARIALNAAHAAYNAAQPLRPYTFSSDYMPSSADAANGAVYLDTYVRTGDVNLAEAARVAERRRQLARLDELAASG